MDPDDAVDEFDEANNWFHALVGPEDLDIDAVPATFADLDADGQIGSPSTATTTAGSMPSTCSLTALR